MTVLAPTDHPEQSEPACKGIAGFVRQGSAVAGGGCPGRVCAGDYALTYVVAGRGRYLDRSGRERSLAQGDLLVSFPGRLCDVQAHCTESYRDLRLVFGGPVFDLLCDLRVLDPEHPVHHLEPVDYWMKRFEALAPRLPRESASLLAVVGLQQLLAEAFASEGSPCVKQEDGAWLARATALLESVDKMDGLDLEDVASTLNMSYASFRRKFTQLSGSPAGKYRVQAMIRKACVLMRTTTLTNKEIADRFGFCNEFHFSTRFKQIVGVCPREYRQSAI